MSPSDSWSPSDPTITYIATRKRPAATKVTLRRAPAGLLRSRTFMAAIPSSEASSPAITVSRGRATVSVTLAAVSWEVAAMAMVAMIDPT